jgi:phage terminase large subunit-like protein
MTTATGARKQPLIVAFTTAGFDRQSICYEIYQYAKKVKAEIIEDETFLPVIYEADEDDDINEEATWAKANPNYGVSLRKEYVQEEAQRATKEAGYENTFRRLQLNQWTSSDTRWIPDELWMKSMVHFNFEDLKGLNCHVGLDLASTKDTTCLMLLFPKDDKFYIYPYFFVPELSARQRTKKDGVNYDQWIKEGYIIETPGEVTDYEYVRQTLLKLRESVNMVSISYDSWNTSQFIPKLLEDGFTCMPFGQGMSVMSAPTKEVEKLIYQEKIVHTGNPVMRWQVSNVMIQRDANDNYKINKKKSTEKVDGAVALVMAYGDYLTNNGKGGASIYESRGIITI